MLQWKPKQIILNGKQILQVIDYSKQPVIASHSACRSVTDTDSNFSDRALRALKDHDASMFLTFNRNDLVNDRFSEGIDQLLAHIEFLCEMKFENMGLGSVYQANGKYVPAILNSSDAYHMIQTRLLERGINQSRIRGIMGEHAKTLFGE